MSFIGDIFASVKNKAEEMKERKEFLNMVEDKAKPIRRKAYMEQMLKEVVDEGIAKAKADAESRVPKKKKTEADFGFGGGISDPYKFMKKGFNAEKKQVSNVRKKKSKSKRRKK